MNTQRQESRGAKLAIILAVCVLAIWALFWLLLSIFVDKHDRGQFGDMFGAINSLFSGLAFAGIIFTILLQRDELKLQRDELSLTREELRGQKEQMAAQNDTLRQQNFENTFFQLLRLHNDIVAAIDIRQRGSSDVIALGRDCFRHFYTTFKKGWAAFQQETIGMSELDQIEYCYSHFYAQNESDVGHYFRSLYNIIKFIDGSNVDDKRLYTNLVRAQLSTFEVALLFYNALSSLGREKFKPLIEEYGLLKMVPLKDLINRAAHEPLYDQKAYGRVA